jgi:hypothetical protein
MPCFWGKWWIFRLTRAIGAGDEESKRLYLYLIDPRGGVLWRDELPFMVTKGSKLPLEESIRESLASQLMAHAHKIGLGEFGLVPRRVS